MGDKATKTLTDSDIATLQRRAGPQTGAPGTDADTHVATDSDTHAPAATDADTAAKSCSDSDAGA